MIGDLDPVIHAPKRLAAMAIAANAPSVSFAFLKEHLEISDSDLSKQMSTLEAAGYVTTSKVGRGRGSSTTFSITRAGRKAYATHRAALTALLENTSVPDHRCGRSSGRAD